MTEPIVLVHGGAWEVPDAWVESTVDGVKLAAATGYTVLRNGGSALDAVEAAVNTLEDNEYFNAGTGGCLNLDGEVGLESSIQRGSDLEAGCVTLVKEVRNPISLARKVLEKSPHSFIGSEGTKKFALEQGFELVPPSFFVTAASKQELEDFLENHVAKQADTVGCVVVDRQGRVAAGTSTGGVPGKYVGRIGDAPLIGSGTYADDRIGAVSSTGHGESILKYCLAHTIIKNMESGMPVQESVTSSVNGMTDRLKNTGGAIAVSNNGEVGFHFTTGRMSWCYVREDVLHYGIEKGQHDTEPLC